MQIHIIIRIWMWIVHAHIDDGLKELLAEVNFKIKVCIHSLKEEKCEWYALLNVLHLFVEGRGVRMVYVCICLAPIRQSKGSVNGVHV